ncbi:hypothetical protein [Agromyces sp. Marseille-P2726]|uniref:hypothetical protein n=1 Tax=Agromyces sp. Marseille-P2726 TaxID=2709132 RepID=UPI0015712198|nr:hypothetical protein [Agromyces sp. Marseille-P2726]
MGLFDVFRDKSWQETDAYHGDTPPCPRCGTLLTKRYVYSEMYCESCRLGLDDEDDELSGESLSVHEAADIWASHGKDEDYTFGFTEAELEAALRS